MNTPAATVPGNPNHSTVDPLKVDQFGKVTELLRTKRFGFRHLWLGDSGMGKTEANKLLIGYCRAPRGPNKKPLIDVTLHIDDKNKWEQQYEGTPRISPEHYKHHPASGKYEYPSPGSGLWLREDKTNINFRGIAYTDPSTNESPHENVSHESVAEMAWDLVRKAPIQVLINIDELADATNGHQTWSGQLLPQIYRKGRAVGLSVVATTQLPQLLPREAFGLSDTIGIFRMSAREAAYLKRYNVLTDEEIDEIANLQIGEFRLFRKSHPVDRTIYKFVLPKRSAGASQGSQQATGTEAKPGDSNGGYLARLRERLK